MIKLLKEEQQNESSKETLHVIIQPESKDAPMRFATRVLVETERENGIWYASDAVEAIMDCAPRASVSIQEAKMVNISKPRNSASTMSIPGQARLNIFFQFLKTWSLLIKPFQHFSG